MAERTTLLSVTATGGFLANCRVEFSPGLNCIIGARGTCKSTLVESIRFAFDYDPERVALLVASPETNGEATKGLVRATLGAGSIRCEAETENENGRIRQVVEREVGADTRVFLDGVREHGSRDILHQIEIFSQGDLQRIANDETLRLGLIDRPNAAKIEELRGKRRGHETKLRELGPQLRIVRARMAALRLEVQPLSGMQAQLKRVANEGPPISAELGEEKDKFERRRRIIDALHNVERLRRDMLADVGQAIRKSEEAKKFLQLAASEARKDLQVSEAASSHQLLVEAIGTITAAQRGLERGTMQEAVKKMAERFEADNSRFYEMRQQQQVVNESLKQQQQMERQIELLTQRSAELGEATRHEAKLVEERQTARGALASIDDEMFTLRMKEIAAINETHGDTVSLTLKTGVSSPQYTERVLGLLEGSRVRSQDDVARALASAFPPSALIDVVETGNGQPFADTLGRDLGQMNRVVAHLAEQSDLYDLEAQEPASRLEITLYDRGQPKPVETLSEGQRATALLPLILRPLPYPLIVDQPEDDLDNNFIFNILIKDLDRLKGAKVAMLQVNDSLPPVVAKIHKKGRIVDEMARFSEFIAPLDDELRPRLHFHADDGVLVFGLVANHKDRLQPAEVLEDRLEALWNEQIFGSATGVSADDTPLVEGVLSAVERLGQLNRCRPKTQKYRGYANPHVEVFDRMDGAGLTWGLGARATEARAKAIARTARLGASAVVHGDVHLRNILLRNDREAHLIDYAAAGPGHPAVDLVRLEMALFLGKLRQTASEDLCRSYQTKLSIEQCDYKELENAFPELHSCRLNVVCSRGCVAARDEALSVLAEFGGGARDYQAMKLLVAWQNLLMIGRQTGLARATVLALTDAVMSWM